MNKKPKRIGITGGIGSGKTTAVNFFKELGIPVFIADVEAKKLMNENLALKQKIISLFGERSYKDGKLNRNYISKKVFKDQSLLDSLNQLVHPEVQNYFESWYKKQNAPYIIYEAAILIEKDRVEDFDKIILVTAPKKERIKRIKQRDSITVEQIKQRMDSQWTDDKKKNYADFIIKNKNLIKLKEDVQFIHNSLKNN